MTLAGGLTSTSSCFIQLIYRNIRKFSHPIHSGIFGPHEYHRVCTKNVQKGGLKNRFWRLGVGCLWKLGNSSLGMWSYFLNRIALSMNWPILLLHVIFPQHHGYNSLPQFLWNNKGLKIWPTSKHYTQKFKSVYAVECKRQIISVCLWRGPMVSTYAL